MTIEEPAGHITPATWHPNEINFGNSECEVEPAESLVSNAIALPCFEFSTDEFEPSDQFDAWRGSFSSMLELSQIAPGSAPALFQGRQKVWDLGSLVLAQFSTDELAFTSLPGHIRRDPIDHWIVTLLKTGSNRTETEKTVFSGGAGEVQIHSLGRAFAGDITRSEMLMLFVPRDFSVETAATLDAAEFSTLTNGMGRLFADYMLDVANRLPTLTSADSPALVAATHAMILACVAPSPDHLEAAAGPIATVLLERARKVIQTKLFEPTLNSELVRRELGISRTRLYNLFEPFGGVMHYIQHRRLLNAHAALRDIEDRRLIFQIAEERGFSDGAEFSRAFKREFGYSPSDVRKRGKSEIPNRLHLQDAPPEQRLNELLRRLQG